MELTSLHFCAVLVEPDDQHLLISEKLHYSPFYFNSSQIRPRNWIFTLVLVSAWLLQFNFLKTNFHLLLLSFQLLRVLKVERIILPSTKEQLTIWSYSFGFNPLQEKELLDLVKHNILTFTGCTLCVKKVRSI